MRSAILSIAFCVLSALLTCSSVQAQTGWYPVMNGISSASSVTDVWFVDSLKAFAVCKYNEAYKTTDGGKNWYSYAFLTCQRCFINFSQILFFGSKIGYVWGVDQGSNTGNITYKTTDGGATWKQHTPYLPGADFFLAEDQGYDASATWVQGTGDPEMFTSFIGRTHDLGLTWDTLYAGKYSIQDGSNIGAYVGDTNDFIIDQLLGDGTYSSQATSDGGKTWDGPATTWEGYPRYMGHHRWIDGKAQRPIAVLPDLTTGWDTLPVFVPVINFYSLLDGNSSYASLYDSLPFRGKVAKTTDYGNTWSYQHVADTAISVNFIRWIDSRSAYLILSSGTIYKTTTGGEAIVATSPVKLGGLSAFPNPATTTLQVTGEGLKGELYVYDILGRDWIRQSVAIGVKQKTLDVSSLPEGIYFLRAGGNAVKILLSGSWNAHVAK